MISFCLPLGYVIHWRIVAQVSKRCGQDSFFVSLAILASSMVRTLYEKVFSCIYFFVAFDTVQVGELSNDGGTRNSLGLKFVLSVHSFV